MNVNAHACDRYVLVLVLVRACAGVSEGCTSINKNAGMEVNSHKLLVSNCPHMKDV